MRVIHIIPFAFEYFNDIKKGSFNIVGKMKNFGIESDIITLQYTSPKKKKKKEISAKDDAELYEYKGLRNLNDSLTDLKNYDIVHLHCPFLGAAGKILQWKKLNPDVPLVVSYYRQIKIVDLISIFILLYNKYYLITGK